MESMSYTQKNPRFRLLSVWHVWTSVISQLQFFLAVVCRFYVHDNTVHLTAEPPCQSHRVSVIRSSSGRQHCLVVSLLIVQQSTGTAGRLLVSFRLFPSGLQSCIHCCACAALHHMFTCLSIAWELCSATQGALCHPVAVNQFTQSRARRCGRQGNEWLHFFSCTTELNASV